MPSFPELKADPDSGFIYIHWTERGARGQRGRSKRESTRTKDVSKAEIYFSEWLKLRQTGATPGGVLTVADLWSIYHKKHVQVKVVDGGSRHDSAWKNLEPHFGALLPPAIDDDVVDEYKEARIAGDIGEPSGGSTVRVELVYLMACMNWCAHPKRKPSILNRSDVPYIELPPANEPKNRWLTLDEIKRLFATAEQSRPDGVITRIERFIWLALHTASRKTAIYELEWNRVDFETNVIDYNVPGRAKTKKRRGIVPISTALRPMLQRMHDERTSELVMGTGSDIQDQLAVLARNADVPNITPHVLRHTSATHMARRGIPLWFIAKVLANTMAMVEKVYAKHCPDDLRGAVEAISGDAAAAPAAGISIADLERLLAHLKTTGGDEMLRVGVAG